MFDEQESDEFELTPELAAFRRQLSNFAPTALRVDRDQLMFNAGRAAERAAHVAGDLRVAGKGGRIGARFWPAATATMTAATFLLSALLLWQRSSPPIARETVLPQAIIIADSADVPNEPINTRTCVFQPTSGYLGARSIALTRGVGALATEFDMNPPATPSPSEPATARQLLDELLPDAIRQRS